MLLLFCLQAVGWRCAIAFAFSVGAAHARHGKPVREAERPSNVELPRFVMLVAVLLAAAQSNLFGVKTSTSEDVRKHLRCPFCRSCLTRQIPAPLLLMLQLLMKILRYGGGRRGVCKVLKGPSPIGGRSMCSVTTALRGPPPRLLCCLPG